jgi:hypothetical protein
MTLFREISVHMLYEALNSPDGIRVSIESPGLMIAPTLRAKQVLYRFKRENREFDCLQIRLSPDNPDKELWIIKSSDSIPPDRDETEQNYRIDESIDLGEI